MGRAKLNGQSGGLSVKYPIKFRKVGSTSIKKGSRLVTKPDGTVVNENDVTQSNSLIIPTKMDTGISTASITDCGSRLRVISFSGFNLAFILSSTQLKMSFINLNNNIFLNKTEFILKTGTSLSSIAVEKLSETKIFVKYMDTITSANIQVCGIVVGISNVANPTIMADTTIETYTSINSVYNFQFVNVFTKSNGVHRVYFFGARQYGGALFRYVDVSADFTSMTVTSNYTGTLDSNLSSYARAQRSAMQIYSETATTSDGYVGAVCYQSSGFCSVYKLSLNHDTNVITLNTSCTTVNMDFYNSVDGLLLSNDKTFLMTYSLYSYTAGYGIGLVQILINADGTLNTTPVYLYFGTLPINVSGSSIRSMVIKPTPFNNKFLISFIYNNGSDAMYKAYLALVDITGMSSTNKFSSPTVYLDTQTNDYYNMHSHFVRKSAYEYLQVGILGYGDTTFSCRVIDFDHVLVDAIAKGSGVLGDTIEVYQITNHE